MNDNDIKNHLMERFNRLFELIPGNVQERFVLETFIAGGAIVNLVQGTKPADYDFFFKTREMADYLTDLFRKNRFNGVQIRAVTQNAISLQIGGDVLQLVTRFVGDHQRVFKDFDFTHCKCYFDIQSQELNYNRDIIVNKLLRYDGQKDKYTLNTLKRLVKFTNRGYTVDDESLINLHKACAKNDLDDPSVMRELSAGFYGSKIV